MGAKHPFFALSFKDTGEGTKPIIPIFSHLSSKKRKYFKRWFGIDNADYKIEDVIDWDHYIARFLSMIKRYIISPAKSQNIDAEKMLKIRHEKSGR